MHRELLALVLLLTSTQLGVAVRGCRNVDLVSAFDETRGETAGESRCTVDLGPKGVGGDEDAQARLALVG